MHPIVEGLQTSHILLSYPIGPRHWLTAFHGHRYTTALHSLIHDPRSNVLIVYGDDDNFTSEAAYDAWVATLQSGKTNPGASEQGNTAADHGKLEIVKITGASHFWREETAVHRLLEVVRAWLP